MVKLILGSVLAVILTTSAQVWAECAWVLWNEVTEIKTGAGDTSKSFTIISTADSRKDCDASLKVRMQDFGSWKRIDDNAVAKTVGDSAFVYRHLCLPDTVDPRGPKGSGR